MEIRSLVVESVWEWCEEIRHQYRPGKKNMCADALSRNPVKDSAPMLEHEELKVVTMTSEERTITELIEGTYPPRVTSDFYIQQRNVTPPYFYCTYSTNFVRMYIACSFS